MLFLSTENWSISSDFVNASKHCSKSGEVVCFVAHTRNSFDVLCDNEGGDNILPVKSEIVFMGRDEDGCLVAGEEAFI